MNKNPNIKDLKITDIIKWKEYNLNGNIKIFILYYSILSHFISFDLLLSK